MNDLITDVKTAITVVGGTIGSWIATAFELIPSDIGKLVSLVGLCFTLFLWYIHAKKLKRDEEQEKRDKEKHKLEMLIRRQKLDNMKTRSCD